MSGVGIGMAIALLNVRGGRIDRGVGSGGGMMGEGGEKVVEGDRGMAIEGWKGGGGKARWWRATTQNTYKCPSDPAGTTADEIKEFEGSE